MKALVIGGTGPTGPTIVNGLLDRGYRVTIMHSGAHEAEFAGPVEDIHCDTSFAETMEAALGPRTFDLVVCQYGRLRIAVEFFIGRTGRFIGVGASGSGQQRDPRWGPLRRPVTIDENDGPPDPNEGGLMPRIYAARQRVLELHRDGEYNTTYIGHPETYGPRQHSPPFWCVIKRIQDGRRQMIIADGGIKISQRAYGENCAQSVLLCVDKPKESAGQYFVVGEQPLHTERQLIELIAETMGAELELVDLPYPLAKPAHYQWLLGPGHRVHDDTKIRRVLGYREKVEPGEAVIRSVHWIIENAPRLHEEWESQMHDTFDYPAEDQLIALWKESYAKLDAIPFKTKIPAHAYRHPKKPNEPWCPPDEKSKFVTQRAKPQYY